MEEVKKLEAKILEYRFKLPESQWKEYDDHFGIKISREGYVISSKNTTGPKVLILSTQEGDWKQLWINGKLCDEGHEIDITNLWKIGLIEGFGPNDIHHEELDDEDEANAIWHGNMPDNAFQKYYSDSV